MNKLPKSSVNPTSKILKSSDCARSKSIFALGIDPGASGGAALLQVEPDKPLSAQILEMIKLSKDEIADSRALRRLALQADVVFCEQIPKYVGEDRSASLSGVLFRSEGFLRGVVQCVRLERDMSDDFLIDAPPLLWMNQFIPSAERSRVRTMRKRQLLEKAKVIWPTLRFTLQTCDAALIALAGAILFFEGRLPNTKSKK